MRKLLRMVGRAVKAFLWIVKGLLMLIAVGVVVMWPVSGGRTIGVRVERYTAGPASGEDRLYSAGCWDGRAAIRREWGDAGGGRVLAWIRAEVQSDQIDDR